MNRRQFLFAAACSAAGVALWASRAGPPWGGGPPELFRPARATRSGSMVSPARRCWSTSTASTATSTPSSASSGPASSAIVAKILPSPRLLDYAMKRAGTGRLMSFHQPFLNQVARELPASGRPARQADADRRRGSFLPRTGPRPLRSWSPVAVADRYARAVAAIPGARRRPRPPVAGERRDRRRIRIGAGSPSQRSSLACWRQSTTIRASNSPG